MLVNSFANTLFLINLTIRLLVDMNENTKSCYINVLNINLLKFYFLTITCGETLITSCVYLRVDKYNECFINFKIVKINFIKNLMSRIKCN